MSFNPKFAAFQEIYGFDESVKPNWQMVPLDGEKSVYLDDAAGMAVQIADAKIAQVSETTIVNFQGRQRRLFSITGKSHGQTLLEVRKDNIVKTSLEIAVKEEKKVALSFNFVIDKGDHKSRKNPSTACRIG